MQGLFGQPATLEDLLRQVSHSSLVLLNDGCHHLVEPRGVICVAGDVRVEIPDAYW